MAELTANFNAMERRINIRQFPVKAGVIMYAGGIGAVNITTGKAEMASDSPNLVVAGRVESYVDNTSGGLNVNLKVGCFRWNNSEANAVTAAELNKIVYVEDDNTICSAPGDNSIIAGVLVELEDGGVWVDNTPSAIAAALGIIMPKAAAVADPAVCAAMTTDLTGVDTGTDMTAAQAAQIVADFAALKTASDANNGAIAAIIDALQAAGLMAAGA
jgi:hypothetical protein